ncbi:hypothetical protein L1049_017827 [Liquidambar formosana]|uniref:Uncharacterized protein n=1 Tax=Liquidambar formosana TaxID=63359 RepID=A0AAP0NKC0_LIQFO
MEEPKPAQNTSNPNPNPNPPNTAQTLPAPQPRQTPPLPPRNKKRPLECNNVHMQDSRYFKMRAVLKDLRPHFIEVLRTPDFQNCKAAHEIREQMKLLMDLYKQITVETVSIGKLKNVPETQPLLGENRDVTKPREQHQDVKPMEQPSPEQVFAKASEEKPFPSVNISEKQRHEDGRSQGTYVVGGSAFGWNFITYPGNKAVYYGVTKESFRSAN